MVNYDDRDSQNNTFSYDDDEDDFLDSLMEDVMGDSGDEQENEPTTPAQEVQEEVTNTFYEEKKEDSYVPQEVTEEVQTEVKPRRPGLLSRINSGGGSGVFGAETKEVENKQNGVTDTSAPISESKVDIQPAQESPKKGLLPSGTGGKRKSLLSMITSSDNKEDSIAPENDDSSNVENTSITMETNNPFGTENVSSAPKIYNPFGTENNPTTPKIDNPFGTQSVDKSGVFTPKKEVINSFSEGESIDKEEVVINKEPPIIEEITPVEEIIPNENEVENNDLDLIDDLLEGINEEEDIEELKKKAQLDPEVEVPLETPEMLEIVVTPDGRTLADMLPGLRSGNKKINQVVSEIRNQDKVVEAQGKKFSDDRYTKHLTKAEKEAEEDKKRVALSMKFLQRNAEFTEQEKIIMKNLGLTNDQLSKVMKSNKLTQKEKNRLLGLGRYGVERQFKGRRYRTTVGDTALLEFLVKFKFANTRILRWISNESQNKTWRKLNRLRDSGLVESKSLIGVPDLWGATTAGTAISGYSLGPGLRPMPKMQTISTSMGINYIAACLWFNTVNVLNLDDFPASNRIVTLQNDGTDRVKGEMLVSELEIRSSLGKEISPTSTTMQTLGDERLYDIIAENVRLAFEEWEENGMVGDSPEFSMGNEYMWVLYPTSQLTLSYHVPDLVVKRERGPNGEPKSIAVELERTEKANARYDKTMLAYKLDEHLYEKVIWITPNTRIARALEKAAKDVGFDRYTIIPIITEDGVYDNPDIWMI